MNAQRMMLGLFKRLPAGLIQRMAGRWIRISSCSPVRKVPT